MIYIKKEEKEKVIPLLSKATLNVNNLKLTADSNGKVTIETGGEWSGELTELVEMLAQITLEVMPDAD
tara:strand:+ start:1331 stop:1534 length:204 start_codon:yes stop_codon:yes gene_type:complete